MCGEGWCRAAIPQSAFLVFFNILFCLQPIFVDVLPTFVFKTCTIATEFIALVRQTQQIHKISSFNIKCASNDVDPIHATHRVSTFDCFESQSAINKLTLFPQEYQSLAEKLLSDEVRRRNPAVDMILGHFLIFNGFKAGAKASAQTLRLGKTLIFPRENHCWSFAKSGNKSSNPFRIWFADDTGNKFKDLLKSWHSRIRPERDQLLEFSHDANQLHLAIETLKVDAKIDGYGGDVNKLRTLR